MCRRKGLRGLLLMMVLLALICLLVQQNNMLHSAAHVEKTPASGLQLTNLRKLNGSELAGLSAIAKEFGSVCHSHQCHAAFELAIEKVERVPRIRHILWKSENVSAYFANQLRTWADIHPNWKYILWRDADLENFVAKHFSGLLKKFRSLPHHIMRVDMIRYLILYHFGGVYADLDYTLVRPLDWFLKYPATVPITAEAIAMVYFGMKNWPPPRLANPAFMISEPKHPFFFFCIMQLADNPSKDIFKFAGPLGLSDMIKRYEADYPATANPGGIVLVPPSRAFDAFANNSFKSSTTIHRKTWTKELSRQCKGIKASKMAVAALLAYCKDVYNMDPITNRSDISYAAHDTKKTRTSYDSKGSAHFIENAVNIRTVLQKIVMAEELI